MFTNHAYDRGIVTTNFIEVPALSELADLTVDVVPMDETGVVAVTAHADDGDAVTITWDEFAGSVTVVWTSSEMARVRLERELVSKVSIIENDGGVEFRSWTRTAGLGGQLLVRLAEVVTISDAILRI